MLCEEQKYLESIYKERYVTLLCFFVSNIHVQQVVLKTYHLWERKSVYKKFSKINYQILYMLDCNQDYVNTLSTI